MDHEGPEVERKQLVELSRQVSVLYRQGVRTVIGLGGKFVPAFTLLSPQTNGKHPHYSAEGCRLPLTAPLVAAVERQPTHLSLQCFISSQRSQSVIPPHPKPQSLTLQLQSAGSPFHHAGPQPGPRLETRGDRASQPGPSPSQDQMRKVPQERHPYEVLHETAHRSPLQHQDDW